MRRIVVIAALLASHAMLFAGGAYMAKRQTMDWFVRETEAANAEVMLGHYGIYKDIGLEISSGRVERAKCNADLGASAMFDGVKDSLSDQLCHARLQQLVAARAPELADGAPIPFNYISTKNGQKNAAI